MVIREFETREDMRRKRQIKDEFKTYVDENFDEYKKSHPGLDLAEILSELNRKFWRVKYGEDDDC